MHQFRAVAVDFDGTLTTAGPPRDDVIEALEKARATGLRLVLVTGRILAELRDHFPDVDTHFDAIVAENGCVLVTSTGTRHAIAPIAPTLGAALADRGIEARHGEVLLACRGEDEHAVLEEIRRLGLECQLVRNRSELMVVPAGTSKGSGLLDALGDLGLSHHDVIAFGDAENDHSLLDVAEVGVAVANAVPSLKAHADIVLDEPDGAGVATALRGGIDADHARLASARWQLTVGTDDRGTLVRIPASPVNILVAGGTGDGKSYLAGLLAEQLIELGYSLLVVDPEGDHVGLAHLRGVLRVGGDRHLPPPAALVPLLRHRYASVVVDLSHLDADDQDRYLRWLPPEIEAQRRASGLPHWVVVDEAHRAMGRGVSALTMLDPAVQGHCLVTWRPNELSGNALVGVDFVLASTNPQPDESTVDIAAAVADVPRASMAELLSGPTGSVVVARREGAPRVAVVRPRPRSTPHFRHEHKYDRTGATAPGRFYFRDGGDRLTGVTAGNLAELEDELARCDRSVLRHHCPGQDFSRWVDEVFHDAPLADALRAIERRVASDGPAATVETARVDLLAALQARRPH